MKLKTTFLTATLQEKIQCGVIYKSESCVKWLIETTEQSIGNFMHGTKQRQHVKPMAQEIKRGRMIYWDKEIYR